MPLKCKHSSSCNVSTYDVRSRLMRWVLPCYLTCVDRCFPAIGWHRAVLPIIPIVRPTPMLFSDVVMWPLSWHQLRFQPTVAVVYCVVYTEVINNITPYYFYISYFPSFLISWYVLQSTVVTNAVTISKGDKVCIAEWRAAIYYYEWNKGVFLHQSK